MKQTSAEWLFSKLWNTTKDKFTWYAILEQAKEMEKQQIIDAHIEGQRVFDKHPHTQWSNDQAEQYYNETYGSKGSDECQFKPTINTSSGTICQYCGREKFLHK